MRSIFRRLLRDRAESLDRLGVDEVMPPRVPDDILWRIQSEHVPMHTGAQAVTMFHGDLPSPVVASPPRSLPVDSPPELVISHYARTAKGEGMWGLEPIIPEGEAG